MAIDFPASPATNDTHTDSTSGNSWQYDGTKWVSLSSTVAAALFDDYAIFSHETTGDGGSISASTWNTRPLNTTEVSQTWASLSSNQVTLDAGTYLIEWSSVVYDASDNQSRLRNITDGTTVAVGLTSRAPAGNEDMSSSWGEVKVTLASSKALGIQHWTANSKTTTGLGNNIGTGETNRYAFMKVTKHL